jgi:uncharacterized protein (DUF1800 family)
MIKPVYAWCSAVLLAGIILIFSSFLTRPIPLRTSRFPYKKEGLTEREAVAHLLDRFTYGVTPGLIDSVMGMGLENWFNQQLSAGLPDDELDKRLSVYNALNFSNTQVCHEYPPGFVIRSMAIKDSVISKDSVDKAVDKKAFNAQVQAYMDKKGFKSDQDLYKQFIDQNILRAAYSRNQLEEVMTDFWFNHFNVSFAKGECAQFIPAYERDVIRPNALGKFDRLLLASAQSPAMLYYLDNFTSVGPPAATPAKISDKAATDKPVTGDQSMMMMTTPANAAVKQPSNPKQPVKNVSGLNENYAREVMELHTIGVDGGYSQHDVTEAARVLTGWTIYPISENAYGSNMKGLVSKIGENNLAVKGFVREGDFLFTPNRHDHGGKTVLGHEFPANPDPVSGYQEGVDLLEMLAHHPSAARFISRKLAVRFVSDNPPQSLIKKMARSFTEHDGDIRQVLLTMVNSREFWDKKALREKTKSPFELAISAVRALKAEVKDPYPLYAWMTRMGEKKYYYQAPTGFPDRAQFWISAGSLLNRMDFGLALTNGSIAGVKVDVNAWAGVDHPDNIESALSACSKLLLPEVNTGPMVQKLKPLLNQPGFIATTGAAVAKVVQPAPEKPVPGAAGDMMMMGAGNVADHNSPPGGAVAATDTAVAKIAAPKSNMLPFIAGVIIGSPEFQRR